MNLIRKNKWNSVYVVWDENSAPVNKAVANQLSAMLAESGRVTYVVKSISVATGETVRQMLLDFWAVSRGEPLFRLQFSYSDLSVYFVVFFFYGHARKLRTLLVSVGIWQFVFLTDDAH